MTHTSGKRGILDDVSTAERFVRMAMMLIWKRGIESSRRGISDQMCERVEGIMRIVSVGVLADEPVRDSALGGHCKSMDTSISVASAYDSQSKMMKRESEVIGDKVE